MRYEGKHLKTRVQPTDVPEAVEVELSHEGSEISVLEKAWKLVRDTANVWVKVRTGVGNEYSSKAFEAVRIEFLKLTFLDLPGSQTPPCL